MTRFSLAAASTSAPEIDLLLAGLLGVSLLVLGLVFFLVLFYVVRYRHNSPIKRGDIAEKTFRFEISWTVATLLVFFGLFIWGSFLYVRLSQPPPMR